MLRIVDPSQLQMASAQMSLPPSRLRHHLGRPTFKGRVIKVWPFHPNSRYSEAPLTCAPAPEPTRGSIVAFALLFNFSSAHPASLPLPQEQELSLKALPMNPPAGKSQGPKVPFGEKKPKTIYIATKQSPRIYPLLKQDSFGN